MKVIWPHKTKQILLWGICFSFAYKKLSTLCSKAIRTGCDRGLWEEINNGKNQISVDKIDISAKSKEVLTNTGVSHRSDERSLSDGGTSFIISISTFVAISREMRVLEADVQKETEVRFNHKITPSLFTNEWWGLFFFEKFA